MSYPYSSSIPPSQQTESWAAHSIINFPYKRPEAKVKKIANDYDPQIQHQESLPEASLSEELPYIWLSNTNSLTIVLITLPFGDSIWLPLPSGTFNILLYPPFIPPQPVPNWCPKNPKKTHRPPTSRCKSMADSMLKAKDNKDIRNSCESGYPTGSPTGSHLELPKTWDMDVVTRFYGNIRTEDMYLWLIIVGHVE